MSSSSSSSSSSSPSPLSLSFSTKQQNASSSKTNTSASISIACEVLSASLGGAVSATILYPLEVLKTKMQAAVFKEENDEEEKEEGDGQEALHKNNDNTMISFAWNTYQQEGWRVFTRGFETSAFQSALEKALYFFAYTFLKNTYATVTAGRPLDTVTNLLLACAAEWAHLPVTLPVDAWTTRIQTSRDGQPALTVLLNMLADPNVNFYKGLSAYYLLCLKPALQYTVYEQVKAAVVQTRRNKTLSAAEAFFLGMVARTIATVAVFPFLRAKVLLQTQKTNNNNNTINSNSAIAKPAAAAAAAAGPSEEASPSPVATTESVQVVNKLCPKCQCLQQNQEEQQQQQQQQPKSKQSRSSSSSSSKSTSNNNRSSSSVLALLMQLYQRDGIAGLYQGLGPELTRGIFSAALMLMIKERISGTVQLVLQAMSSSNNSSSNNNSQRHLQR